MRQIMNSPRGFSLFGNGTLEHLHQRHPIAILGCQHKNRLLSPPLEISQHSLKPSRITGNPRRGAGASTLPPHQISCEPSLAVAHSLSMPPLPLPTRFQPSWIAIVVVAVRGCYRPPPLMPPRPHAIVPLFCGAPRRFLTCRHNNDGQECHLFGPSTRCSTFCRSGQRR
jgi:hypothetical protein